MKILDSGERRKFDTGSQRDVSTGKGRFDLLPLDVVSILFATVDGNPAFDVPKNNVGMMSDIYSHMHRFTVDGVVDSLYALIIKFSLHAFGSLENAIATVALHFEMGAKKYSERNWEKGQPLSVYVDSGLRHATKHYRGDRDEPHDGAFLWNLMCLAWTHRNKPELNDLPYNSKS